MRQWWLAFCLLLVGCTGQAASLAGPTAVLPTATAVPPTATPLPTPTPTVTAVPPERIAEGIAVYNELYCGVCHTLDAAGTKGTFGPTHNGMGQTAVTRLQNHAYAGTAQTPAEYIRESIIAPEAYMVPDYALSSHQMPIFSYLEAEKVEALVVLLLGQ